MQDIRIHEHGGPEQLAYDGASNPIPRRGEAIVRVVASGITSRCVVHRQTKAKAAYKNSGTNRPSQAMKDIRIHEHGGTGQLAEPPLISAE
jgi:NADPH:quinone reductase-like Zn-dependent oxidoreductase